jgi:putative peptide zinc metalloprotease protein
VRWLLHPLTAAVALTFAIVTATVLALNHALIPSYQMLVWNEHAGIVIAINAAIAWLLILLHELAHLAAARATGAPARITISTRLQFLTAQTDVSGAWGAPRRHRITVYMAGLGLDFVVVGIILLVLILAAPHGLARELLCVAFAETLLAVPTQFMVFMRTDLYFVLQDLTRCANLYADGSAYLRHLMRRVTRRDAGANPDPSRNYPPPQRRAVRVYSVVLLAGTAICLGVEFAVSFPALIALVVRAMAEIGATTLGTLDGAVLITVLVAWQVMWCARWWDRHRDQVRSLARNHLKGGAATWR